MTRFFLVLIAVALLLALPSAASAAEPVDACWNIAGDQITVSDGYEVGYMGACFPLAGADKCANLPAEQATVPAGYVAFSGSCFQASDQCFTFSEPVDPPGSFPYDYYDILDLEVQATIPTGYSVYNMDYGGGYAPRCQNPDDRWDDCANLEGLQTSVPPFYTVTGDRVCNAPVDACPMTPGDQFGWTTCPGTDGPDSPEDACYGMPGVQTAVPDGYQRTGDSFCQPIDYCVNLGWDQTSVPPGYVRRPQLGRPAGTPESWISPSECIPLSTLDACGNLAGKQSLVPRGMVAVSMGTTTSLRNDVNILAKLIETGLSSGLMCRVPPPDFTAPATASDGSYPAGTSYTGGASSGVGARAVVDLAALGAAATRPIGDRWYGLVFANVLYVDGATSVVGTTGRDAIYARDGMIDPNATQATLKPMRGSVTFDGRAGNDDLAGSYGNDKVAGGPGDDFVRGHSAKSSNSWWDTSAGRDALTGGPGRDELNATDRRGDDTLDGGLGRDRCLADVGDRVRGCEQVFITVYPKAAHAKLTQVRGINPARWTMVTRKMLLVT